MAQEQIVGGNNHDVTAENPDRGRTHVQRAPFMETALNGDLGEIDQRVRTVVQERPFLVLAGAVVTGYLLGRVLSRL